MRSWLSTKVRFSVAESVAKVPVIWVSYPPIWLPKIFTAPPVVPAAKFEVFKVPETITVPVCVGIVVAEFVSCTVPAGLTVNPVSKPAAVPVSNVGKSRGRMGSVCSPVVIGSISKLSRCPG